MTTWQSGERSPVCRSLGGEGGGGVVDPVGCLTSLQQASVSQGRLCLTSLQHASVSQGRICLTSLQHASVSQGRICLTSLQQASVSQGRLCLTSLQQASVSQGRLCLTSLQQASVSQGRLYLTSLQQASVSQGRRCSDSCWCCHTETEGVDHTCYLIHSQYTDAGPTSPSADPVTPGAWQDSHWGTDFEKIGSTPPRKCPTGEAEREPQVCRHGGGHLPAEAQRGI